MSCYEKVIRIIREELRFFPGGINYRHDSLFQFRSFSRWALLEIARFVKEHRDDISIELLEDFKNEIDQISTEAETSTKSFMFAIFCDSLQNVIDRIRLEEGVKT